METKIDSHLSSFVFLKALVDPPCSTEEKYKTKYNFRKMNKPFTRLYSVGISSVDARKNSGNESQRRYVMYGDIYCTEIYISYIHLIAITLS